MYYLTTLVILRGKDLTLAVAEKTIKVADEVWIATALLHREKPEAADFTIEEIVNRAQREGLCLPMRPGVYVHVLQHCVANRAPNPGRYRMLVETAAGRRRIYRRGDSYHPARADAKITPEQEAIPARYQDLLEWYRNWSEQEPNQTSGEDPLLALRGSGRGLWSNEHADDYVRRLRQGWE
jgi:hypothetical protein